MTTHKPEDILTLAQLDELRLAGFVVLRATTHRNTQERIRIAEQRLIWEAEHNAHTVRWAQAAFTEERRISDRLTFVYGEARAAGLTAEQLAGPGFSTDTPEETEHTNVIR